MTAITEDGSPYATYDYHIDGQLASAKYADRQEDFQWDGLALVKRNNNSYLNEPHPGGGAPVLSSEEGVMLNDMLGTMLGAVDEGKARMSGVTAFGETNDKAALFTGKPMVDGLGYAFLFRNYRPQNGKWLTTDPIGYPDGWNNLAYCSNYPYHCIDIFGCWEFMRWLYTGNGNANDTVYNAALIAASESIGIKTATNLYNAAESITQDIIANGQGTIQLGLTASGGGSTGIALGAGIVFGYSRENGWQWGVYSIEGIGSYIGVGGSLVLDLTISANDSIYDLGGNALTIGGSGSNEFLSIGGEINVPIDGTGASSSMSIMAGTLIIPSGTPAEIHSFLTNTQIFGHNELENFLYDVFYE